MIVFLNGDLVPEEKAVVPVLDRCFLYGDGLFETIRIYHGRPFRWEQHLDRLERGAAFLKLRVPFSAQELASYAARLVRRNQMPESVLRITLSRGVGPRGYSVQGADKPALVMTLHPAAGVGPEKPLKWRLVTSSLRVPANDPVAQFKTCNKLHQILARIEAEAAGADEALLLNTDRQVAEAAGSNLFWIEDGAACTTPLASGILAGITRAVVLEICAKLGIRTQEKTLTVEKFQQAQGPFLSLSSLGIVKVVALDGRELPQSPWVEQIHEAFQRLIIQETGRDSVLEQ